MTVEANDPWDALVAPTTRLLRSSESRENSARKRSWTMPSTLPDLPHRDGWVHKWVRTETRNVPDKTTYGKRVREGWEPIDLVDYPELQESEDKSSGRLEIGGLIACRMPAEMVAERRAYLQARTNAEQSAAEEHYLRDSNEVMRKVAENKRRVVFGR